MAPFGNLEMRAFFDDVRRGDKGWGLLFPYLSNNVFHRWTVHFTEQDCPAAATKKRRVRTGTK
jgi:hypothetical protein